MLSLWGYRVDPDTDIEEIITLLSASDGKDLPPTLIDRRREKIMQFIRDNMEVLREQLACDGNCYAHPDAVVMRCYLNIEDYLIDPERKRKK